MADLIAKFIARGGVIQQCPARHAAGSVLPKPDKLL